MEEIIKLISSLSVLIASFAGFMAISKWKSERFDKAKIDALEKYEKRIIGIRGEVNDVLKKDIGIAVKSYRKENNSIASLGEFFYEAKEEQLKSLKNKLDECKVVLDEYTSFAGEKLLFNFNYYNSMFNLMSISASLISYEDIVDVEKEDIFFENIFLEHFATNKAEIADMVDFLLVHMPFDLFLKSGKAGKEIKDFRGEYNYIFFKMIRLEKIYLHSFFFKKIMLSLKIFIVKYNVIGRVVLMNEKSAVLIRQDGIIYKVDVSGNSLNKIEKNERKGLMGKMVIDGFKKILS